MANRLIRSMILRVSDAPIEEGAVMATGIDELTLLRLPLCVVAALFSASASGAEAYQMYPTKPIRFIVPSAAGSGTDILARTFGQKLAERWGQSVIVDDR